MKNESTPPHFQVLVLCVHCSAILSDFRHRPPTAFNTYF